MKITNKLVTLGLVATLVVTASLSVIKFSKADTAGCSSPQSVLDAHILSTGEFGGGALASVTNNSDCSFNVGLDDYQTSNNVRFDSQGTVIGPRQSIELHINVPDCQYRLALTTDLTVLDSATVRTNVCGSGSQSVSVAFHVHANCIGENIPGALVSAGGANGTTDGSGNVTLSVPASTTVSWNASANNYNSASGTVASGNGASQDVTLTRQCGGAAPTPTPVAPAPVPPVVNPASCPIGTVVTGFTPGNPGVFTCGAVPTFTPTAVPPTVINNTTNGPCAINASNSCNTTTTTNTTNTNTNTNINSYVPTVTPLILPTYYQPPVYYPTYTPPPVYYPPQYPVYPIQTQQTLNITKTARDITRGDNSPLTSLTARAGDGIEFTITVSAPYNTSLNNVVISDALPAGMNYTYGSTTLNNNRINDGIVSGGVNIGTLSTGQQATIVFYATVNQNVAGGQVLINTASVRADNTTPATSNPVTITIGNYSVVAAGLGVKTGATDDAFALAGFGGLISSAFYIVKRKGLSLIKLA